MCLIRSLSSCRECFGLRIVTFLKLLDSPPTLDFNSFPLSTRFRLAWCWYCFLSWKDIERKRGCEGAWGVCKVLSSSAKSGREFEVNKSSLCKKLNVLVRFIISNCDTMLPCCCFSIVIFPVGHALISINDDSFLFSSSVNIPMPPVVSIANEELLLLCDVKLSSRTDFKQDDDDDNIVDVVVSCCCCRFIVVPRLRKTFERFSFEESSSTIWCSWMSWWDGKLCWRWFCLLSSSSIALHCDLLVLLPLE